jgi:hypothetical protein
MSRVFDFAERWGCRNRTEARLSRGEVERESQKAEEGSAVERHCETDFWPNEDRLYSELAPIDVALCGREITLFSLNESILLYDLTSTN